MNIKNIVQKARENAVKKYNSNKCFTNMDEGHEMIIFCSKTLSSKKVNDWGRDEDHDIYLGIDEQGWVEYSHRIEHFVGPLKIKEPTIRKLSDDFIIDYLQSDKCQDNEYLMFMNKAYNLI